MPHDSIKKTTKFSKVCASIVIAFASSIITAILSVIFHIYKKQNKNQPKLKAWYFYSPILVGILVFVILYFFSIIYEHKRLRKDIYIKAIAESDQFETDTEGETSEDETKEMVMHNYCNQPERCKQLAYRYMAKNKPPSTEHLQEVRVIEDNSLCSYHFLHKEINEEEQECAQIMQEKKFYSNKISIQIYEYIANPGNYQYKLNMIGNLLREEALRDITFDINERDIILGFTLLHYAVTHNANKAIIELLLKNGANPEIADNIGNTPLHFAAQNNHYTVRGIKSCKFDSEIFTLLLKYSSNKWELNDLDHSIFNMAIENNNEKAIRLIAKYSEKVCIELGDSPHNQKKVIASKLTPYLYIVLSEDGKSIISQHIDNPFLDEDFISEQAKADASNQVRTEQIKKNPKYKRGTKLANVHTEPLGTISEVTEDPL